MLAAAVALILVAAAVLFREAPQERVIVDASRRLGFFKDLRGFNNGPLSPAGWSKAFSLNLTARYYELGARVIRFHDLWATDELDSLFPSSDADPTDPASYNFAPLDEHVTLALRVADLLILRIGYDWNDPPKNRPHLSVDKLAEVVKHLVLHYTKGWAGGYHHESIWFEIWNEPDIDWFWNLSEAEFFQLYEAVARAVKSANPRAVVGGPGIAWDLGFLDRFLAYVRAKGVPLDFVSWHIYARDPIEVVGRARAVRQIMEKHGYGGLPSVLTEWNFWREEGEPWDVFRGPQAASFQAAVLLLLEDAPVDVATLYRGDAWTWGGLFYQTGAPGKPFYAWLAYRQLIEGSVRVAVGAERGLLYAAAGLKGDGTLRILVVNYRSHEVRYEVSAGGYRITRVLAVDQFRDFEEVNACRGSVCSIGPYTVQLLVLERG